MSQKKSGRDIQSEVPHLTPRPPSPVGGTHSQIVKDQERKNGPLAFILLALALAIGLYAYKSETPKPTETVELTQASRQKMEVAVNRHIQVTNRKMEVEKDQVKVASYAVPKVGEFVLPRGPGLEPGFNQRADKNEMNAIRDLRRNNQPISISANDLIHGEMATQEEGAQMDEAAKQEYVRQFIANARRNGYEVQLSPDLQVIGVRQIRQNAGEGGAFR